MTSPHAVPRLLGGDWWLTLPEGDTAVCVDYGRPYPLIEPTYPSGAIVSPTPAIVEYQEALSGLRREEP